MSIQNANSVSGGYTPQVDSVISATTARQPQAAENVAPQVASDFNPQAAAGLNTQAQVNQADLKKAVDSANLALSQNKSDIEFSIDKGTGRTVVKLVETKSGDVISQYPSKEAIAISQAITEFQQQMTGRQSSGQPVAMDIKGLLVKQQA